MLGGAPEPAQFFHRFNDRCAFVGHTAGACCAIFRVKKYYGIAAVHQQNCGSRDLYPQGSCIAVCRFVNTRSTHLDRQRLFCLSFFSLLLLLLVRSLHHRAGQQSPATRVRKRTRAKQKLNSAVEGVSKPHVFDKEIFALALPTLGAVLIDPCLSLVDTGYVGRLGALSLAAIGPCAAAFNFVFVTAR